MGLKAAQGISAAFLSLETEAKPIVERTRMISKIGNKAKLAASLALACALTGAPAGAQNRGGGAVFVDLGRWTIIEHTRSRYCELRLNSSSVDGLTYIKSDGRPGRLRLGAGRSRSFGPSTVTWQFDETEFEGQVLGSGLYAPLSDTGRIEQLFRQAKTLTVRDGGQIVAQLSLKTSSAGFRLLNQCAEQWRIARAPLPGAAVPQPSIARREAAPPSRPAATSRPAVAHRSAPERTLPPPPARPTGPYPPNRELTALNPNDWVRADDFSRFSQSRLGSGTVRFSLLVNERGRVEECTVSASSGSRDFDSKACRSLQKRARFEPATDANGDARSARYSSSVRFAVSE